MRKTVERALVGAAQTVEDSSLMSSLMLLCAVLASLALGVLAAYGLCLAMFGLFRVHARQTAQERLGSSPVQAVLKSQS